MAQEKVPPKNNLVYTRNMKRRAALKGTLLLYVLVAPAVVLLFLFNYKPLLGLIMAFQDFEIYRGIWGSAFVGFKHFAYFLKDPKFWQVLTNTVVISFYDIAIGFVAPIIFALLVNELVSTKFKKVVQTVSYLPHFLSWIVVSGLVYQILSPSTTGLVNGILVNVFHASPEFFMTNPKIFRGIVVGADIWASMGWSAILYFSAFSGIDQSLYEAASIDGAGRLRQTLHVTLPGISSVIVIMFLLKLSNLFNVGFDRIFTLQNPAVYEVSDVISTYVYRLGLQGSQYSLSTAVGLVQSVIGFLLLLVGNKLAKRFTGSSLY